MKLNIPHDIVNLVVYSGGFIGIGAGCITALSFESTWKVNAFLPYIFFVAASTAALYAVHRVIGLKKLEHIRNSPRLDTIRRYSHHIRIYGVLWAALAVWFFWPLIEARLIILLLPGVMTGALYVLPVLPKGRRIRDLGWTKIVMIAWSWGWLTAFIPYWYFAEASLQLSVLHGLERMLFIFLITIPFEIRDIEADRSVGLSTLPAKLGRKRTFLLSLFMAAAICILALFPFIHYYNLAYPVAMAVVAAISLLIITCSYTIEDDYLYSGLTDGLMIIALWVYAGLAEWV